MASTDTLEILAKVVDEIKPLADRARGAPLRADDWNQLVGAIGDLARLITAREQSTDAVLTERFAARTHTHDGAATLSWFDAPTRELIDRATTGSVEQTTAIKRLDGQISSLAGQIKDLGNKLDGLSARIEGLLDTDVERKNAIERVQLDLEAVRSVEGRVTGIANNLGQLDDSRRQIFEFRDSLRAPTGDPIDIAHLSEGVGKLDDLRSRLELADGQLADLKSIQSQIVRLQRNSDQHGQDLRSSVTDLLHDATIFDGSGLEDRLGTRLRDTVDPRIAALEAGLVRSDTRFTTIEGSLDRSRADIATVNDGLATVGTRIDGLGALTGRLSALSDRVTSVETVAAEARVNALPVSDLRTQLATLTVRTDGLNDRLTTSLATVGTSISQLGSQFDSIRSTIQPGGLLDGRLAELGSRLDQIGDVTTRIGRVESNLDQQAQLLAGVRAETSDLANRTAVVSQLQAGLESLQSSRAASDNQLQVLLGRQNALDQRFVLADTGTVHLNTNHLIGHGP